MEDQERIKELEIMEEEELNTIKVSLKELMEEDTVWEQGKNSKRAEGIRSTLVPGSSLKREGEAQKG